MLMAKNQKSRLIGANRWICIQMEQHLNRCLATMDITAVQSQILLFILQHADHGTSLTAIHQEFDYSMATLSSMVKRLRAKGYVRVEHCDNDDRRKLLYGTEKCKQMQKYLDQTLCVVQDQLFCGFSQEELDTLERLQEKMLKNLLALNPQKQKEESNS